MLTNQNKMQTSTSEGSSVEEDKLTQTTTENIQFIFLAIPCFVCSECVCLNP